MFGILLPGNFTPRNFTTHFMVSWDILGDISNRILLIMMRNFTTHKIFLLRQIQKLNQSTLSASASAFEDARDVCNEMKEYYTLLALINCGI